MSAGSFSNRRELKSRKQFLKRLLLKWSVSQTKCIHIFGACFTRLIIIMIIIIRCFNLKQKWNGLLPDWTKHFNDNGKKLWQQRSFGLKNCFRQAVKLLTLTCPKSKNVYTQRPRFTLDCTWLIGFQFCNDFWHWKYACKVLTL